MKKKLLYGFLLVAIIGVVALVCAHKKSIELQNTEIIFNKNGNVSQYQTNGFSNPENDFTWTENKEVLVSLPMPKVPENYGLMMNMDITPFLAKKIKKQVVDVFVNDVFAGKLDVNKSNVYTVVIPQDVMESETLNIKMIISDPKSPKELNISDDARKLGIAVKKIVFSPINLRNPNGFNIYKLGNEISFFKDGNAQNYVGDGWATPENSFSWTDGENAYVKMFINDVESKKLQLSFVGHCIFDDKKYEYQNITVFANNTELKTFECSRAEDMYSVVLPESVLNQGAIELRFNVGKPFSPGSDTRKLGIAVKTMEIDDISSSGTKIKIARWLKNDVLKADADKE